MKATGYLASAWARIMVRNPLAALARRVRIINQANGWNCLTPADWNDNYRIPAVVALVHTELSEAVEAFRKNDQANFKEEIADTIIRCLDICAGLEIEIDEVIDAKLEKNAKRGYKHGGKRV